MYGVFTRLEFEHFSPGLYLENQLSARYVMDDQPLISTYTMIADELRDMALTERETVRFVRSIMIEQLGWRT